MIIQLQSCATKYTKRVACILEYVISFGIPLRHALVNAQNKFIQVTFGYKCLEGYFNKIVIFFLYVIFCY